MKKLFGALFVLITAATGCATESTEADPPTVTLHKAASEAEALATLEALAPDDEPGVAARAAWRLRRSERDLLLLHAGRQLPLRHLVARRLPRLIGCSAAS